MIVERIGNFRLDLETGAIKNPGYRIYKASWHSHYNGLPIKSANRRPRWKFISVHETEDQARSRIKELQAEFDG